MVLLTVLTACSGEGSAGSTDRLASPGASVATVAPVTPSGGSGTESIAPTEGPEGAVGRVVLRTYQSWWDAKVDAFGRLDSDGAQLSAYSGGQALSDSMASLHQLHEAKMVMVGLPRTSPRVSQVDLKANPQTAVVEDCLDVSEWHQADAASGATKDPQQRLSRYLAVTKLRKSGNSWLIVEVTREVGRTC
ncbi:hypothetical protein [Saccharothrix sp. ST-888]|uniref:hypothetical protein n=1 Tax=Saccharothrix sp. ST-888 TaxID=1427391 RepID=UPI0012E0077F|nr:hypothetical protein [Saccharothrix sp. ST-888]